MSYSIDLNDSVACSQHVGLSYAGHELHVILPSLFMDGLDVVIKAISFKEEGSSEGEILGYQFSGLVKSEPGNLIILLRMLKILCSAKTVQCCGSGIH
jgi:hypothetical protein